MLLNHFDDASLNDSVSAMLVMFSRRTWRKGDRLEAEGCAGFRKQFGTEAYTLHHRFFWHTDRAQRLWLAAEDGCEGVLAS